MDIFIGLRFIIVILAEVHLFRLDILVEVLLSHHPFARCYRSSVAIPDPV